MKRNHAHANLQAIHLETLREEKERTADFALRVSNLSLHKVSNSVSEVSQVTNPDPRSDISCLLKIFAVENICNFFEFLASRKFFQLGVLLTSYTF